MQVLFEHELHRFFARVAFEIARFQLIDAREHQVRQHVAGAARGAQPVGRFAEPVLSTSRYAPIAACAAESSLRARKPISMPALNGLSLGVAPSACSSFSTVAFDRAIRRGQIEIDVLQRPLFGARAHQHHEGDLFAAVIHRTDGGQAADLQKCLCFGRGDHRIRSFARTVARLLDRLRDLVDPRLMQGDGIRRVDVLVETHERVVARRGCRSRDSRIALPTAPRRSGSSTIICSACCSSGASFCIRSSKSGAARNAARSSSTETGCPSSAALRQALRSRQGEQGSLASGQRNQRQRAIQNARVAMRICKGFSIECRPRVYRTFRPRFRSGVTLLSVFGNEPFVEGRIQAHVPLEICDGNRTQTASAAGR